LPNVFLVFVTPTILFSRHHPQRMLRHLDRFLIVEEMPQDVMEMGEIVRLMRGL
jgi:hypothetical protein